MNSNLFGNGTGNIFFHFQDVPQITIVALCPKVRLVRGSNELSCDPKGVFGAPHAAFHEVVHSKFATDLVCSLIGVLLSHGEVRAITPNRDGFKLPS